MSIVGPRPLVTRYLDRYTPEQMRRHDVRPGITGLAQINGRQDMPYEERFKLDVWYVDHVSLALDLKIMCRTPIEVLRRRGASEAGYATGTEWMGNARGCRWLRRGVAVETRGARRSVASSRRCRSRTARKMSCRRRIAASASRRTRCLRLGGRSVESRAGACICPTTSVTWWPTCGSRPGSHWCHSATTPGALNPTGHRWIRCLATWSSPSTSSVCEMAARGRAGDAPTRTSCSSRTTPTTSYRPGRGGRSPTSRFRVPAEDPAHQRRRHPLVPGGAHPPGSAGGFAVERERAEARRRWC